MRSIRKASEPASLTEHRRSAHSSYANYPSLAKQELRLALVTEQRGLCCYCMGRIEARSTFMKIEHWECQDDFRARQLDYSNLLGACVGGERMPLHLQHCDTSKGNKRLKFNPAEPAHFIEQRVRFGLDGSIQSTDATFNGQLHNVLNLNLPVLRNCRKAVLDSLALWLREYQARHRRGPDKNTLVRKRAQWLPTTGTLQPFAGVAVSWIDARLERKAV